MRSLSSLGHAVLVISGKPPFFESSHIQEGAKELIEVGLLQRASPPYGLLPHSTVVVGMVTSMAALMSGSMACLCFRLCKLVTAEASDIDVLCCCLSPSA